MALAGILPLEICTKAVVGVMGNPDAIKPRTPYLYHRLAEALCEFGAEEESLDPVKRYWGSMVSAGADAFWECFDPLDYRASPYGDCHNGSYCHAWSCTPSYLLRVKLQPWLEKHGSGE